MHGFVSGTFVPILNVYFDDGTENIRATAFRENAARVLGLGIDETKLLKDDLNGFEKIKNEVNGKQFTFIGKVQMNDMFKRKEFTINAVQEIDPALLVKEIDVIAR